MDYQEYAALYPDGPGEGEFERFSWDARRVLDRATTGVDGVRKLSVAPPQEEYAAQAVRRCEAAVIRYLWRAEQSQGLMERADGTVTGRVVTGLSAGSESVTYAAPGVCVGLDGEASMWDIIRAHLSGVADRNGVMLLYMGRYPIATARQ